MTKEDAVIIDYSKVSFKKGDTIPGNVQSCPKESCGDIAARDVYKDGRWTLEMGRRLVTEGKAHDVQFKNQCKTA